MEFKKCKKCKWFQELLCGDHVENVCLGTGDFEHRPLQVEDVDVCPGFESSGVILWEARKVGFCYGVCNPGKDYYARITVTEYLTGTTNKLYFMSKEAAKLVAAALNQEVYARMIEKEIKNEGEK